MSTELRLTRTLDHPVERVWSALTDADALADWLWPRRFATRAEVDLRVGGGYRFDGTASGMAVTGEYVAVDAPRRLVFTWRWDGETDETLVTIELVPTADGTELTLTHERFADDAARDDHATGWNDCLDRLPAHLGGRTGEAAVRRAPRAG
jgi:uncharacterized protein YndB with AHSA1/START domain